jgi:hypothetical protein
MNYIGLQYSGNSIPAKIFIDQAVQLLIVGSKKSVNILRVASSIAEYSCGFCKTLVALPSTSLKLGSSRARGCC